MHLVLGFGDTGASFLRYLKTKNLPFLIMDSRTNPPGLSQFKSLNKKHLSLGSFDEDILDKVKSVLVSPGISFNNKVLTRARKLGIEVETDIDIFLKETKSKTILITGTNGKTTVVNMVYNQLKEVYGEDRVISCGNIGKPVLDTLSSKSQISVIEVSSFHLEHSKDLKCDISVLLNVDQDHLDRHESIKKYLKIKQKILSNSHIALVGENNLIPSFISHKSIFNFQELLKPFEKEILNLMGKNWPFHDLFNFKAVLAVYLALTNKHKLLKLKKIKRQDLELFFRHKNISSVFTRLPHRYEILGKKEGVTYINDSKGTNLLSLEVALKSSKKLYGKERVLLLCGGDLKNQDLSRISLGCLDSLKHIFSFGKDRKKIIEALQDKVKCTIVKDLGQALANAKSLSKKGDVIMLSPACASTDMFKDYKDRGDKFKKIAGFV